MLQIYILLEEQKQTKQLAGHMLLSSQQKLLVFFLGVFDTFV